MPKSSWRTQSNFVIGGNSAEITEIDMQQLLDVNFDNDLSNELVIVFAMDYSPTIYGAFASTESTFKTKFNRLFGYYDSHRIMIHGTLNTLVEMNNGKICGFRVSNIFIKDKIKLSKDEIVLVRKEDKLIEEYSLL